MSFPLIKEGKIPKSFPASPSHLIGLNWVVWPLSEERLENYLDKKREVTWKGLEKV